MNPLVSVGSVATVDSVFESAVGSERPTVGESPTAATLCAAGGLFP
jgi:hypothetical protein